MYYMAISIFLILFGLLWTIAGMTVCKKLYDKVRNEDHQERGKVIQRIMKTYAMAQLLSWPKMLKLNLKILKLCFSEIFDKQRRYTDFFLIFERSNSETLQKMPGSVCSCRRTIEHKMNTGMKHAVYFVTKTQQGMLLNLQFIIFSKTIYQARLLTGCGFASKFLQLLIILTLLRELCMPTFFLT